MTNPYPIRWPKGIQVCLLAAVLIVLNATSVTAQVTPSKTELRQKKQWVEQNFLSAKKVPPFSFVYNGKASKELLPSWKRSTARRKLDSKRTEHTITWTDPATRLVVKAVAIEYNDFPVVEWTVYFKTEGTKETPILQDIQGLDIQLSRGEGPEFVLHGNKGDYCVAESYEPFQTTLTQSMAKAFSPTSYSGKSCDGPEGWPYYNLQTPTGGLILAIGWPAQWAASFKRDNGNGLSIRAGQQLTHLVLKPGEEIRTPLIVALQWDGKDVVRSQNLWRRWYVAHVLPRVNGQPAAPISQIQVDGKDTNGVEEFLQTVTKPDICWRDAGAGATTWYPSDNGTYKGNDVWLNTGTWDVDTRVYPKGFKPFSDYVHKRQMQFLLWFEPERVGNLKSSWLATNHPEWLLTATIDAAGKILNEGHPEAFKWLTNHIDRIIKDNGLDWYREDMNGNGPLTAWRNSDATNRQGITENLYVQGHLAYWDALVAMNPGLRIDSCASGGRRNDIETMRRAVPLLRSDFQFPGMPNVVEGNQSQTLALSSWLPYQGTGCYVSGAYAFRSFYMAGFGLVGGRNADNVGLWKQAYAECKEVAPIMLNGDYYPLTPYSLSTNVWMAWQFDWPETGKGYVQVFRRPGSDEASKTFQLKGLNARAQYELKDYDSNSSRKVSATELMRKGLVVDIKQKPGSALFTYQRSR